MGWKASMVLLASTQPVDIEQLLEDLGCYNRKKKQSQLFEEIIYPPSNCIYIGQFAGNTILCLQALPETALQEELSEAEAVLCQYFPNTDIVTLVLHSTVNYWGYSVVNNGKKIRVRAGDAETGTFLEKGRVLEEEKELFSKAQTDADGNRFFVFPELPEEQLTDDQVGESFIFALSSRYLGEPLHACEELWNTPFEGYSYSKKQHPWWKFW